MKGVTVTRNAPDGPIHSMFGLSYASWLVLPRTLLQSMPLEWQERFVQCVNEYDYHWAGTETVPPGGYRVMALDESKKFTSHDMPPYDRGRTFVTPSPSSPIRTSALTPEDRCTPQPRNRS